MIKKKVNFQVVVEIASLLTFILTMVYLLISDTYLNYVTPRIKPYIIFAIIIMSLWTIFSVRNIFNFSYRKNIMHCLILVVPIMVIMCFPHGTVTSVNSTGGNILLKGTVTSGNNKKPVNQSENLIAETTETEVTTSTDNSQSDTEEKKITNSDEIISDVIPPISNTPVVTEVTGAIPSSDDIDSSQNDTSQDEAEQPDDNDTYTAQDSYGQDMILHGIDKANKTLVIDDNEYLPWLNTVFGNIDEFVGYKITVTGAVYRNNDYFASDEFVPARLVMTCCVADLVPCGFVCKYDGTADLPIDSWITVTGTVFKGSYDGNEEPQLKDITIKDAQPIKGYIYPY